MSLRKFILLFDIFPQEVKFFINGKEQHKTVAGAISGILILFILIGFTYSFGKDIVERKYPIVIRNQAEFQIPPVIQLNAQNLPIAFGLVDYDSNAPFQDEQAFKFSVSLTITKRVFINGEKSIQIQELFYQPEQCDRVQHFQNPGMDQVLKAIDFEKFYCLPLQKNLKFGGSWDLDESYSLGIYLQKCNQTLNPDCYPDDIMKQQTRRGFISLYFPHFNVDPSSQNPIVRYSQVEWTAYTSQYTKTVIMNFQKLFMQIDNGFLLQDFTDQQELGFSNFREFSDDLDDGKMVKLWFLVDTTSEQITIRYLKFQEALANIGGFMKIVVIAIGVLVLRFQEIDYYNLIISKIFVWKYNNKTDSKTNVNNHEKEYMQITDKVVSGTGGILLNNHDLCQFESNEQNREKFIAIQSPAQTEVQLVKNIRKKSVQIVSEVLKEDNEDFYESTFRINHKLPQNQRSKDELNQLQDQNFKLSLIDQIKILFGFDSLCKNYDFFTKSKEIIEKQLNLEDLIKQLNEIDVLKYLLLTDEQRHILKYLKPPTLVKEIELEKINGNDRYSKIQLQNKPCIDQFDNIKNQSDLDSLNKYNQEVMEYIQNSTVPFEKRINQKIYELLDFSSLLISNTTDSKISPLPSPQVYPIEISSNNINNT